MNWRNSWQIYALGSAFFAGLTALFGKVGVLKMNSDLATFIRTVVILFVLVAVISFRGEWEKPDELPMRSIFFLVLSAIATGASWICYYRALQLGPASRVAPVDKLSVVFAMALAFAFLGESMTPKMLLGGGLIAAGAVIIALA